MFLLSARFSNHDLDSIAERVAKLATPVAEVGPFGFVFGNPTRERGTESKLIVRR